MAIPFLSGIKINTAFASAPSDSIFLYTGGSNTPGGGSEIIFGSSTSATAVNYNAKIAGVRNSLDNGSSDLQFLTTHVATATSPSTKMTIKSDGKIGIGTVSPESKLTIKGDPSNTNQPTKITNNSTDTHTGLFLNGTGNAVNEKYGLQFGNYNEYSIGGIFGVMDSVSASTSGDITIDFGNGTAAGALIERVRFTHEGRVGIGTNAPSQKLTIREDSTTTYSTGDAGTNTGDFVLQNNNQTDNNFNRISFQSTSDNNQTGDLLDAARITAIYPDHGGGNPSGELVFETKADAGSMAEAMRIDRNGKVGVGAAPTTQLQVRGAVTTLGDARYNLRLDDATTMAAGVGAGIVFGGQYITGNTTPTNFAAVWSKKENATSGEFGGELHLGTRVDNGNISSDLIINSAGDATFANNIYLTSSGKVIKADLSSGNTTRTAEIEFYNGSSGAIKYMTTNGSSGGHEFYTQGNKRLEIKRGGDSSFTGKIITTSTATGAITLNGGTGVSTTGAFVLMQNGDGAGNGMAITSSYSTSHRIWKDDAGNLNIGSSGNTDAFKQDITGNVTIEGTVTATNLSGSSSGTNTGDQDLSGLAAASHTHAASDITSGTFPTTRLSDHVLSGNNSSGTNESSHDNWNNLSKTGFYSDDDATGRWTTANWSSVIHFKLYDDNNNWASQLGFDTYATDFYYRRKNNGNWSDWYEVYHEGHKPTPSEIGAAPDTVVNQTDFVSAANGGTFTGNVDFRGGGSGYNTIRLVNNTTADNNKQTGITTLNYAGNNVSIMQYATNSNANTVYYGSADGAHRGIQNHRFYVNSDVDTASSGHGQALHIASDKSATFASTLRTDGYLQVINASAEIWIGDSLSGTDGGFIKWNSTNDYLYIGNSYNSAYNEDIKIDNTGKVTFGGTISSGQAVATVSSGTNFEARKGSGSGAVGFGGTDHQTGLIEGVDGGGLKLYTAGNDVDWGGAWALNTTWSGTGMTVQGNIKANTLELHDINGTVSSKFKIYGWDDELQFTKRHLTSGAHTGTLLALDYTTNAASFLGAASFGGGVTIKDAVDTSTDTGKSMLVIHNENSDISQQRSYIDFKFTDTNANHTPQVRIGAQVGPDADANSIEKEGAGSFVVYTAPIGSDNLGNSTGLAEQFRVSYNGTSKFTGNLVVGGNLTIEGTTTTIDTSNLLVEDKNIILGNVDSPDDTTADGGGITLKGANDYTITWSNTNNRWDFNQGIHSSGTITGSNISGSTSGTNTGDQDLSGYSTTSHNHDGRYLRTHSRLQDDFTTITQSGVHIWDVSEASDEPPGASDGLLTIKFWDSSCCATAQFHDFHQNNLWITKRSGSTWQTDWAQVYSDEELGYRDVGSVTSATTTTTVASVSGTTYAAVFFDYVIYRSSDIRAGTVVACSDGTNVSFTETSTTDLGDTSDVTLAVDYSSSNFRLRATTTSSTWTIKSLVRAI